MSDPKYKFIVGIVSVAIGVLFGLFGRQLFKFVIFLIGFLVYGQILGQIFAIFIFEGDFWAYALASLIGGLLGGFLALGCFKCHTFCIGFVAGGTLFGMACVLVLFFIEYWMAQIIVLVGALIVGCGSYCFTDFMVILITSFQGASMFVAGILLIANKAVSVTQIDQEFHWESAVYVGVTFFLTVIGVMFQNKVMDKKLDEDDFISVGAYRDQNNLIRASKDDLKQRHRDGHQMNRDEYRKLWNKQGRY